MHKQTLLKALETVAADLRSATMVSLLTKDMDNPVGRVKEVMQAYVEVRGNFDRFDGTVRSVCDIVGLSPFYAIDSWRIWMNHLLIALDQGGNALTWLRSQETSMRFVGNHSAVLQTIELLRRTIEPTAPTEQTTLEVFNSAEGRQPRALAKVLNDIGDLCDTFLSIYPDATGSEAIVTYMDSGSNYRLGINIKANAEIGKNLAEIFKELCRCLLHPFSYWQIRNDQALLERLEVVKEIHLLMEKGIISSEHATTLKNRLLHSATALQSE